MPWSVIQDWLRYYQQEPFGYERDDLRTGFAAAGLANLWGKPKKGKSFEPKDFMVPWNKLETRKRSVSPDDQFRKILLYNKMMGGKVVDKRANRSGKDD